MRTGHDSDGWFPCGGAELVGRDKAGQLAVAPLALSCLRRALPSEMPLHELVHTLAKYTLHVDKGTQQLHHRTHTDTPHTHTGPPDGLYRVYYGECSDPQ